MLFVLLFSLSSSHTSPLNIVCNTFLPSDINRLHHPRNSSSGSSLAQGVSSTGANLSATARSSSSSSRASDDPTQQSARVLVFSASEEESSGYVSLMNCIFSAQKAVSSFTGPNQNILL